MFERLAQYPVILVTGPQRSGTTIASRCIAADTGHTYIDENDYGPHDRMAWLGLVLTSKDVVIQCPSMCRYVHEVSAFVIMMYRNVADIVVSQRRIGWGATEEALELARYDGARPPIAEVKYNFWREHQRPITLNWLEVEYGNLAAHPLWIDKRQRADFGPRQTEVAA